MKRNLSWMFALICALALLAVAAAPASAYPSMYTYVANWEIPPRAMGGLGKSRCLDSEHHGEKPTLVG
jgi:hypothetical protein